MQKFRELFSTRKKTAVTLGCIGVLLVTLGICIALYAAHRPETASGQTEAIGGESAQNFAFADAGVDPVEATAVSAR